jgi:hypothetical protein
MRIVFGALRVMAVMFLVFGFVINLAALSGPAQEDRALASSASPEVGEIAVN